MEDLINELKSMRIASPEAVQAKGAEAATKWHSDCNRLYDRVKNENFPMSETDLRQQIELIKRGLSWLR
jgi:hypothetical protein